jgi:hypothetical protein
MTARGFAYPDDNPRRPQRVVAVGFLTERDLSVLGQGFKQAYRLHEGHDFHELLAAIDAAERQRRDP